MNLNTLLRHEVLGNGKADQELVDYVAGRIADAGDIRSSRQFPYQFLAAYLQRVAAVLLALGAMTFGEADEKSFMHKVGADEATSHDVLDRARANLAMARRKEGHPHESFRHARTRR